MTASLQTIGGAYAGREFELPERGVLRFGTDPFVDCRLSDLEIDPVHFQLEERRSGWVVVDLGSQSGTLVNGTRISTSTLHDGDVIEAGALRMCFRHELPELKPISARTFAANATKALNQHCAVPLVSGSLSGRILLSRNMDGRSSISQAMTGLDSVSTIERLRNALDTLYRVSNHIQSEVEQEPLYTTILQASADALHPDRAFLLLLKEGQIVPVKTWFGEEATRRAESGQRAYPSLGVVREAMDLGQALVVADAQIDPRFNASSSVQAMGIRSALCVPLIVAGEAIGALYLDLIASGRSFEEHELELMTAIGRQSSLALERAGIYDEMEQLFFSCVRALVSAIEAKDVYTHGHSERVAQYATRIAEEMGMDDKTIDSVQLGALLHDIGKIGVPESVLSKQGRLTSEELDAIRTHPAKGAEILEHIRGIPDVVAAVRWHHEMVNGQGYPDKLSGDDIPMAARIVSVADAFDAMTSHRSYRRNLSALEAMDELQGGAGAQFDAQVVSAALRLLRDGRLRPMMPEDKPVERKTRVFYGKPRHTEKAA